MNDAVKGGQDQESGPEFSVQRVYIKDLSLEVPNSPQIFLKAWEPEINLDLATQTNVIKEADESVHEVVLTVTVTVKLKDEVAFLVEIKQAGIFSLVGFPEDQIQPMLGSYCPNLLYPYARAAITDAVVQGGFPQLYLSPVNFDALYQQHVEQQQKEAAKS